MPQFALRWTPAVLVAALICYWSIVTSPPPIALALEPPTTADAAMRAAFVTAIELAWFDG